MENNTKERLTELSFYKPNTTSYYLILLAVCIELVFLVVMLGLMPFTMNIGIFIVVNILFLLLLFTCAMETKVYTPRSSFVALGFACFFATRVVTIPYVLDVTYSLPLIYVFNGIMILLMSAAGIISYMKVNDQKQFKEDGKINSIQMSK